MIVRYSSSDGPTLVEAEDFHNLKLLGGWCEHHEVPSGTRRDLNP